MAFGPWVLLSLAAALQVAVWLDAKGRHSKVSVFLEPSMMLTIILVYAGCAVFHSTAVLVATLMALIHSNQQLRW